MTKMASPWGPGYEDHLWRCTCGDSHFLQLSRWDDEDGSVTLLDATGPERLRDRLRAAGRALLGRPHHLADVVLDAETAREVADLLREMSTASVTAPR